MSHRCFGSTRSSSMTWIAPGRPSWCLLVFWLAAGCFTKADLDRAAVDPAPASEGVEIVSGGVHLMPVRREGTPTVFDAPAGAHLDYFGGPVISHVKVETIFWDANVKFQDGLNQFYAGVTDSA